MASVKHQIEYLAAAFGRGIARTLTPRMADSFGAGLGSLVHRLMKSRRDLAFDNLKQGMGDGLSDEQISEIVRSVFRNIGRMFIEFARFGKTKPDDVNRIVVGKGAEGFREALEKGNGGFLATAHFGNWELLGAWVAAQGFPVDLLVATQHNPLVDRMINDFRSSMGVGIVELTTSSRGVFKTLRANRIAATAPDQHAPAGTVIMDFFGRPASIARGPALFAIRCKCPVIPVLLRRERYDRHVLIAGDLIYPPNSGDEDADVTAMTERYVRFIEENIRLYPDQWLWTHNRWKLSKKEGNHGQAAT
ncbi:MAG: lysophospholipid acyltransferase family protein [bacterium]|nr:lysophospholipid acyltransferase family protein [bacterium]